MGFKEYPLKSRLPRKMKKLVFKPGIKTHPFEGQNLSGCPISNDELLQIFFSRAAGTSLVMLSDSCHPGTVAKFSSITAPATVKSDNTPKRRVRFLPPRDFLSRRSISRLGLRRALRKSSPPGRDGGLLMSGIHKLSKTSDFQPVRPEIHKNTGMCSYKNSLQ